MYLLDTLLRTRENKEGNNLVCFIHPCGVGVGMLLKESKIHHFQKTQWVCQSIRTFLNLQICLILTVDHSHTFSVKSSSVKLKNLARQGQGLR